METQKLNQYHSFPRGAQTFSSTCTTEVVVQKEGGCKSANLHSEPRLGTSKTSLCLGQRASRRGILAPAIFFFSPHKDPWQYFIPLTTSVLHFTFSKVWAVQNRLVISVSKNGNKGAQPKICLPGLAENRSVLSTPLCNSCMQTLYAFS